MHINAGLCYPGDIVCYRQYGSNKWILKHVRKSGYFTLPKDTITCYVNGDIRINLVKPLYFNIGIF